MDLVFVEGILAFGGGILVGIGKRLRGGAGEKGEDQERKKNRRSYNTIDEVSASVALRSPLPCTQGRGLG